MKTVIICSKSDSLLTGGEIYFAELIDFYRRKERLVKVVFIDDIPARFTKNKLACNLWFFFSLLKCGRSILVQDASGRNYFFICNIFLRLLNYSKIVPFVQDLHRPTNLNMFGNAKYNLILKSFLKMANSVIVNSNFIKKEIVNYGFPAELVEIVSPTYQKLCTKNDYSLKKKKNSDQFIIVCAANYREIKGQEYLIEAIKILGYPNILLNLVGSPEKEPLYFEKLKEKVNKNNLHNQIFLTGWLNREELIKVYSKADIFVLPSIYESYGMVLLEAMSFALAVVASKVGGIQEIVSDGLNGILVPPADPKALAKALERIINSSKLRAALQENAYERAKSFPNWEMVCMKFYDNIQRVKIAKI